MKRNKVLMAIVAVFISISLITAQTPAQKETKAEPAKKECCSKKSECKGKKKAECKGEKKAECKSEKKSGCKSGKKTCCDHKKAK